MIHKLYIIPRRYCGNLDFSYNQRILDVYGYRRPGLKKSNDSREDERVDFLPVKPPLGIRYTNEYC